MPPKLPKYITHKNMKPVLDAIAKEPFFQIGSNVEHTGQEWFHQEVTLEFPLGEIAKDGLTTMALVGRAREEGRMETCSLTGKEGFAAQGLEGKVRIRKDLFGALMNMRDTLPEFRGRIVTR